MRLIPFRMAAGTATLIAAAAVSALFTSGPLLDAQEQPSDKPAASAANAPPPNATPAEAADKQPDAEGAEVIRDAEGRIKLSKKSDVWLDLKKKELVVAGEVCLRAGQLEMLVTRKSTKTHESIVSVDCEAKTIHAGLMALGAIPGQTVRFQPKYQAAHGPEIEVIFKWTDGDGKERSVHGQDWVRHVLTQRVMDSPFVFAGSMFVEGQYLAEQGDVVCVSNFPTAMLDLPVRSSDQASQLMFEAFSERVPPVRTPVSVVFRMKEAKAAE